MKQYWQFILWLFLAVQANAAVEPVTLRLPNPSGWAGQRIPFIVELRASGSFAGTATFELPQLAGALAVKIGSPVLGSEDIDGESWMVQSHEFALFVQRPGLFAIPPFTVHFSHHQGYTGPITEVQTLTPGAKVEIKQPPGMAPSGFFLTTESLTVHETWEPKPGPVQVGAMLKRTITQKAVNVSGMLLASAPINGSEGLRIYPGTVETEDHIDRGDLVGERIESLTYLFTLPGTQTLPALTYTWWNPKTQQVQSTTLDALTIAVTPAPATGASSARSNPLSRILWILGAAILCSVATLYRKKLMQWARRAQTRFLPPEEMIRNRLLAACNRNDAQGAEAVLFAWLRLKGADFQPDSALQEAVLKLHRHLYGSATTASWKGEQLKRAMEKLPISRNAGSPHMPQSALPALNP